MIGQGQKVDAVAEGVLLVGTFITSPPKRVEPIGNRLGDGKIYSIHAGSGRLYQTTTSDELATQTE